MNNNFYKQLIENLPTGYSYNKIICDKNGIPCDFEILEVNFAFERLTGLKGTEVVGRRATEVIPNIKDLVLDWIRLYGDVAINREKKEFEQFFEASQRWYKVNVYSPEKYYFITNLIEITKEMIQLSEMERLIEISEELLQLNEEKIGYQKISEDFLKISGAKYAAFNLFDEDGKSFTTMSITADNKLVKKISDIIGFKIDEKKWEYNSE